MIPLAGREAPVRPPTPRAPRDPSGGTNLELVTPRRQQILDIAADLFASRGFHGVSVAELGSACGISGPALYKHFESKDSMLAEMLVTISETLLSEGRSRVSTAAGAREALVALIEWHIEFALAHRPLIVVQDRDWSSLPDEARERVRALQRSYVDVWATQLRRHDDRLGPEAARTRAHVLFGLLNSTPHSGRLPDPQMHDVLREMAHGALGLD
ncbi:DNA-binding transcriptional regulator, AcrR family [Nocardioides exalbidus]|uniref:DNA-binding transcriptional regulator, AcrR family n=1 Tax=Nocardioides exalbidus TaxID=402596 RepID=A0A1H4NNB3_9ACTN|nr:DNA-binding transcriptional regulator, AcrR family [Nocardioides exalbidus]